MLVFSCVVSSHLLFSALLINFGYHYYIQIAWPAMFRIRSIDLNIFIFISIFIHLENKKINN